MLEMINTMINEEMLKTGNMRSEPVEICLVLNEQEFEEFYKLDLDERYEFERDEDNLYITYCEEV